MNASFSNLIATMSLAAAAVLVASALQADPLPGRDRLKFSQAPMIITPVADANGIQQNYYGHDELSTAYGFADPATNVIPSYDGRFMADDFADKLNSPVLHVKWWGSYNRDFIDPNMPVNKFLISFESDQPADAAHPNSQPAQPLLSQTVLRAAALSPGSGTYTEKLIRGPDPILGESLYEYNAELDLKKAFPESADTVYWLKIAAMVDVPAGFPTFDPLNPQNSPVQITQWGWHNRDYTVKDPLASTAPAVVPGEMQVGTIGTSPVYHFQDDAVAGDVRIDPLTVSDPRMPNVFQTNMSPQFYRDFIDGPSGTVAGTPGIGAFSKDLAFELYTQVPEPGTCLLFLSGCVGLALLRQRLARS